MTFTIYTESRAGRSLVPHYPQVGDAVSGVERIRRVNEDESPFLLAVLLSKERAGRVHCVLDLSLEAGAQLRITACILGISAGYF